MTNSDDLARRRCVRYPPGTAPLDAESIARMLCAIDGWILDGDHIRKTHHFPDHHHAMAFVNAVAWISHREDHHPDIALGYNQCTIGYSTHSVGGLSENDFICAAKIDALFAP